MRIPRENLLNSVADVSSDGQYLSAIKDSDQVVILEVDYINYHHYLLILWSLFNHGAI